MSNHYSLIIVGAGIAGLRVGIEALKKYPKLRCCILEKYNYVGGRVVTFRKDIPGVGEVQWEIGAGRISTTHRRVLGLMKKYGLTFTPIDGTTDWIKEPSRARNTKAILTGNDFTELESVYFDPIRDLPQNVLETHTLKEILDNVLGPEKAREFYVKFPYYSEIHTLRADIALKSFEGEMYSNEGFGVCAEGLSSITDAMRAEFLKRGGQIFLETPIISIKTLRDLSTMIITKNMNMPRLTASMCVLALHSAAFKHIQGVNHLPVLKHLKMMPLLRMYAIFPVKRGVSWFSGLAKIVTNSPIRYIIPINAARGIVMISYTDGADAEHWFKEEKGKHGYDNVRDLVMTEIRQLFPDRTVPDPVFFKLHPWTDGCSYWRPGIYDIYEESLKSLHPSPNKMPNLFMCGESFAVKQCWMESAVEQADKLLAHPVFTEVLKDVAT